MFSIIWRKNIYIFFFTNVPDQNIGHLVKEGVYLNNCQNHDEITIIGHYNGGHMLMTRLTI